VRKQALVIEAPEDNNGGNLYIITCWFTPYSVQEVSTCDGNHNLSLVVEPVKASTPEAVGGENNDIPGATLEVSMRESIPVILSEDAGG
jgi:hypothetical protein